MKTGTKIAVVAVVAVALTLGGLRQWRTWEAEMSRAVPAESAPATKARPTKTETAMSATTAAMPTSSPAERMARVEQIRKDYDEIRAKMSAEFAAAGAAFPGIAGAAVAGSDRPFGPV